MKKILIIFLSACLIISSFILCGCDGEKKNVITGTGDPVTKSLTLDDAVYGLVVTGISRAEGQNGKMTVVGNAEEAEPYLSVTSQNNILESLVIKVENGVITVSGNELYDYDTSGIEIKTNVKLSSYRLNGGFETELGNVAENFTVEINGATSGTVTAGEIKKLDTVINGAASLTYTGKCESFNVTVNGSGNISAYELKANKVSVVLNGAAGAEVAASESLYVEINGTGNVSYDGDPTVEKKIGGLGTVTKR